MGVPNGTGRPTKPEVRITDSKLVPSEPSLRTKVRTMRMEYLLSLLVESEADVRLTASTVNPRASAATKTIQN